MLGGTGNSQETVALYIECDGYLDYYERLNV